MIVAVMHIALVTGNKTADQSCATAAEHTCNLRFSVRRVKSVDMDKYYIWLKSVWSEISAEIKSVLFSWLKDLITWYHVPTKALYPNESIDAASGLWFSSSLKSTKEGLKEEMEQQNFISLPGISETE